MKIIIPIFMLIAPFLSNCMVIAAEAPSTASFTDLENSLPGNFGTNASGPGIPECAKPAAVKAVSESDNRRLTEGEREMLEKIFVNGVRYDEVRVYHRKWTLFQPETRVMSPDGNIYYPPADLKDPSGNLYYSEDFSKTVGLVKLVFIHEMGHVYQYHQGIDVMSRRLGEGGVYRYKIEANKDLNDYTLEQQAEIIKDYYLCLAERNLLERSWNNAHCVIKFTPALDNFDENPDYLRKAELKRRRQVNPF